MTGGVGRSPIPTERLMLEPVSEALARAIVAGDLAGVGPAAGWPHEHTLDGLRAAVEAGTEVVWLIRLKSTGEVVGECGTKGSPDPTGSVEIGYGLAGPSRGRGYGSEAVRALASWAFSQPGCSRLTAETQQDNLASRRLLERLGFTVDRVVGGHVWYTLDAPGSSPPPPPESPSLGERSAPQI
jgi:RimJ/RimL family protein N-acetyltransferase